MAGIEAWRPTRGWEYWASGEPSHNVVATERAVRQGQQPQERPAWAGVCQRVNARSGHGYVGQTEFIGNERGIRVFRTVQNRHPVERRLPLRRLCDNLPDDPAQLLVGAGGDVQGSLSWRNRRQMTVLNG